MLTDEFINVLVISAFHFLVMYFYILVVPLFWHSGGISGLLVVIALFMIGGMASSGV